MTLRFFMRAAATLSLTAAACAQLPPTPPTTAALAPIVATPSSEAPNHAEVTYAAGLLNVRADDSSLNQILRKIADLTGMKITGGVTDIRVFGDYGPADPPTILATLLNGTGSNMLLRQSDTTGTPVELVLTPRSGGVTPPNPSAATYNERPQPLLPQRMNNAYAPNHLPGASSAPDNFPPGSGPRQIPPPQNNVLGSPNNTDPTAISLPTTNSVPTSSLPTPSTATGSAGIVDSPNPPPPGSTTSPNPNGVRTPQQIFEQLKAMQKKSAAAPTTTPH